MISYDYLYDKSIFNSLYNMKHHVNVPLSLEEVKNAVINPKIELKYWVYNENKGCRDYSTLCEGYDDYVETIHESVIYLGGIPSIWGHCITDVMRRIWFLRSDVYKEKYSNCKVVFVTVDGGDVPQNLVKLLKILDIDATQFVPIRETTKYDEVIIPDNCFFRLDKQEIVFTDEYKKIIDDIRTYYNLIKYPIDFEKVYFTYSKYKKGKVFGEVNIEKYMERHGYRVIAPEDYSLEEIMNILVNCKAFASTIGSCAHNSIFLNEHTEVILIPRAHYLTSYQMALNELIDLNITFIDCNLSILVDEVVPSWGPFLYCVSDNLQRYFGEANGTREFYKWNYSYMIPYILEGLKVYDKDRGMLPAVYYAEFLRALRRYIGSQLGFKDLEYNEKVDEFLKNRSGNVYIYGCGHYGEKTKILLEKKKVQIAGYVVSQGHKKSNSIDGISVFELNEVNDENALIIIGVGEKLQKSVIFNLEKEGYKQYLKLYC